MRVFCIGWHGFYEVDDLGNVYSCDRVNNNGRAYKGKKLKPIKKENGYMTVNLTKPGFRKQCDIHRLVLSSFQPCPGDGYECCHNDGDRSNNNLKNLRWDTRSGNFSDKIKHGTRQSNEFNGYCKYSNKIINEIRNCNMRKVDIIRKYGISATHLDRVLSNKVRDLDYEEVRHNE